MWLLVCNQSQYQVCSLQMHISESVRAKSFITSYYEFIRIYQVDIIMKIIILHWNHKVDRAICMVGGHCEFQFLPRLSSSLLRDIFCLFVHSRLSNFFRYLTAVTITGVRAANVDLWVALMVFSSEGSFSCHTYCNTGPRFIRFYPNNWHPCPTVEFELGTQGSPDLSASALTTQQWCATRALTK
jgi:hypothetical protein